MKMYRIYICSDFRVQGNVRNEELSSSGRFTEGNDHEACPVLAAEALLFYMDRSTGCIMTDCFKEVFPGDRQAA